MQDHADHSARNFINEFTATSELDGLRDDVVAEITQNSEVDFESALSRFRKSSQFFSPSWSAFVRISSVFLAIASATWLLIPKDNVFSLLHFRGMGSVGSTHPTELIIQDPATRLLLYGDESAPNEVARWHALWMSEPDNPVFFSRYVEEHLSSEDTLPPNVLTDAQRIDPNNGYWLLVSACLNAQYHLKKTKNTQINRERSKTTWHTENEDEVLRRIEMIHEAAAKPRLQSHQLEYLQTALGKIPEVENYIGRVHSVALLAGQTNATTRQFMNLPSLMQAAVRIAIERNDRELAVRIIRDWNYLSHALTNDSSFLVSALVSQIVATQPVNAFQEATEHLDLRTESELLKPIIASNAEFQAFRNRNKLLNRVSDINDVLFERKLSMLSNVTVASTEHMLMSPVDPIDIDALRPSRRMEFAFGERLAIPVVAITTLFSLIMIGVNWLLAFRKRRVFALRALLLLPAWKLIFVTLIAGSAPLLWYLLITRSTPLGWHEWSLLHGRNTYLIQGIILICMIIMLPSLIAVIAVERHTKVFRWRWPGGVTWRFLSIIFLFVALPASGLRLLYSDGWLESLLKIITWLTLLALVCVIIGMLWSAWREMKNPIRHTPRRLSAGIVAAQARLFTLMLLPAWFWLTQIEEKFWTKNDTLMNIDLKSPAPTSHESKVQMLLREQVINILGPPWPR